ncbi:MAG TPA: glycosyltransferase family 39 protein [Ktedonobacterales bacterium]|nr:glycosyltransferase family 39 protein [Ktedonobacterales bacterium]
MQRSDVGEHRREVVGKSLVSRLVIDRPPVRLAVYLIAALALLLLAQNALLALTAEPLRLALTPKSGTLSIDGQQLAFPLSETPTAIYFAAPDPLTREFQIDGTDSANNFSLDPDYLAHIAATPYYRFQTWMRDSSSYSAWRDVRLSNGSSGSTQSDGSVLITLAGAGASSVSATLLRPETPSHVYLRCGGDTCGEIVVNRNDRYVLARDLTPTGAAFNEQRMYFPESARPFVAEVLYLLVEVALWSLGLLILALALQGFLALCASLAKGVSVSSWRRLDTEFRRRLARRIPGWLQRVMYDRWDGLALVTVLASFAYVLWVAVVEYQGQPHILDASAYLFQAKIFASGRLSASAPGDLNAFQGPFMVVKGGRWFAQYPPMTSLLLAVGIVLHAPWLVEPLLGTLALWGIFRLGRYFYSGWVAWLAVLLGALSPFYTYLAASYMSHTVALFFSVYFLLSLVRFTREWRWYDLALAALFAVGLLLTRELSAVVIGVAATAYLFGSQWRTLRERIVSLWPAGVVAGAIIFGGLALYLLYNLLQTGGALVSPRTLFFPGDRYGFGQGIGFYGQHTFAAGMVILDQLLTILMIDLYGWPFYLTLALLPLSFLRRDAGTRWDIFCALLLVLLCGAQAGYFYHGIYLGPRYLFETLPFLLLLTARGITGLAATLTGIMRALGQKGMSRRLAVAASGLLLAGLLACNLFYYSPRQAHLYQDYTGLPATITVDARAFYGFHPQNAIVLTNNWYIYNYILWPLNDPTLRGATVYAYAPVPDAVQRLHREYPGRVLYMAQVAPDGAVTFLRV